ncbi:hypothetical protein HYV72_02470, partial [Candidatus Uhrbacteria bacterium]|nr:hypothetical protein [Candidatus Uhrbacteria bacterium]
MESERLEIKAASKEILHGTPAGNIALLSIPLEHKNGYVFAFAYIEKASRVAAPLMALMRESAERLARHLDQRSHLQHRFEQAL